MPISTRCHCGAVAITYEPTPEFALRCNCSVCRRLGAVWIYADVAQIEIEMQDGATIRYSYGDHAIAFHSCATCSATTHWENLKEPNGRMAVNLMNAEPDVVAEIPQRLFDGAETWTFLT